MDLFELAVNIVGESEFEVSSVRGGRGKAIKLKEQVLSERFSAMIENIRETLGCPSFVHTYYGFIWEKDGKFLAFNAIEEYYNYEVISFFVFDKLPRGKKLNYRDYVQIVEAVGEVFSKRNLVFNDFIHYHDNTFCFLADSREEQCILTIKRRSLFFGYCQKEYSDDGTIRMIPRYSKNKALLSWNPQTIRNAVQSCFVVK